MDAILYDAKGTLTKIPQIWIKISLKSYELHFFFGAL